MATAGGTSWVRFACVGGALLGACGCGDRHLTAILPAAQTQAPPDECGAGEGRGAGPLPPMGWNGWNTFGCGAELDQAKFRANADALVERGLRDAGYEYMNLDQCWSVARGADGAVIASPTRFPDGIAALGSYVHEKNLKFGIHSTVGDCASEVVTPGSQGHEARDVATYASFGVDYVKYTSCGGVPDQLQDSFEAMGDALLQASRPMLYSVSDAPFEYWQSEVGQLWRTYRDVQPNWQSILEIIDATTELAAYAGQGGYNDSDMLWIGNAGLSEVESRAYFSMWAMLASPLLAGNDLTVMSEELRAILTNEGVIALNQDPLRLQGNLLSTQGDVMLYAKPLAQCGARGVVLLNRGESAALGELTWSDLGLAAGPAAVRDLWSGTEALETDGVAVTVAPHDVVALRISGNELPLPRGDVDLSDLTWTYAANGRGPVQRDRAVSDTGLGDGGPLTLDGQGYDKGLGVSSPSLVRYRLGRRCHELSADIGIDDSRGESGSVVFQVWADGEKLFDSGVVLGSTPAQHISVNISGRSEVRLWVGEVEDTRQDHANWAEARLRCDE